VPVLITCIDNRLLDVVRRRWNLIAIVYALLKVDFKRVNLRSDEKMSSANRCDHSSFGNLHFAFD
jgi:hypothetical protein